MKTFARSAIFLLLSAPAFAASSSVAAYEDAKCEAMEVNDTKYLKLPFDSSAHSVFNVRMLELGKISITIGANTFVSGEDGYQVYASPLEGVEVDRYVIRHSEDSAAIIVSVGWERLPDTSGLVARAHVDHGNDEPWTFIGSALCKTN